MKIVLTGSTGHISKPLATDLFAKGHSVTVISSKADKQAEIEVIGAKAAIGSVADSAFLSKTFSGADIVYLMEPPFNFFDQSADPEAYWLSIAESYRQAVEQAGVTRLVHLSSIGAHTDKGVGMLATHHKVEQVLNKLPESVSIKTMRPVGFFYNMFAFIPAIKATGAIIQNYGGKEREPWVSPLDIADTISEEMEKPFAGRSLRYIASEELSPDEVAVILGEAIGKPDLTWNVISDEQFRDNLLKAGFHPQAAEGLTEMNAARRGGMVYEDYFKHRPTLGKVKLASFAKEFAKAYHS